MVTNDFGYVSVYGGDPRGRERTRSIEGVSVTGVNPKALPLFDGSPHYRYEG